MYVMCYMMVRHSHACTGTMILLGISLFHDIYFLTITALKEEILIPYPVGNKEILSNNESLYAIFLRCDY